MGLFDLREARRQRRQVNQNSSASDPGGVRIAIPKLRRLAPELFPAWWKPWRWPDRLSGRCAAEIFNIGDRLIHGDSRAALVANEYPLLVSVYTDELDCVALLRFPQWLLDEYRLKKDDRLLAVFNYWQGTNVAPDLSNGPLSLRRYENLVVYIADFLSDDVDRIERRKAEISETEWQRTREFTDAYLLRFGQRARDGSPIRSHIPAV